MSTTRDMHQDVLGVLAERAADGAAWVAALEPELRGHLRDPGLREAAARACSLLGQAWVALEALRERLAQLDGGAA